ncbi:MAG: hypothetical protein ABFD76_11800 [Smithella sp.]
MKPKIIIRSVAGVVREVYSNVDIKVEVIDYDNYCGGDLPVEKKIIELEKDIKGMKEVYKKQ